MRNLGVSLKFFERVFQRVDRPRGLLCGFGHNGAGRVWILSAAPQSEPGGGFSALTRWEVRLRKCFVIIMST